MMNKLTLLGLIAVCGLVFGSISHVTIAKSRESNGLSYWVQAQDDSMGDYLVFLDGKKIARFKSIALLTQTDLKRYAVLLETGGDFQDNKVVKIIDSGSNLMKYISYEHLLETMRFKLGTYFVNQEEEFRRRHIPDIFMIVKQKQIENNMFSNQRVINLLGSLNLQKQKKARLVWIYSFLGGLKNKDPRVRLYSTHLLRRLIPYPGSWSFIAKLIQKLQNMHSMPIDVELDSVEETVQKTLFQYETVDFDVISRLIYRELNVLSHFIGRFSLLEMLKKDGIKTMSRIGNSFSLLSDKIEREGYCKIPLNYFFDGKNLNILLESFSHMSLRNQEKTAMALFYMLRRDGIEEKAKALIVGAVLRSSFYEKLVEDSAFSDIERRTMSLDKRKILANVFSKKNGVLQSCEPWSLDQYDAPDINKFHIEDVWGKALSRFEFEMAWKEYVNHKNAKDGELQKEKISNNERLAKHWEELASEIRENLFFAEEHN